MLFRSYRIGKRSVWAAAGEILGTGLIGSLLSYPVMVWFTGSSQSLYWFVYTPRFFGGAISGSLIALFVLYELDHSGLTRRLQKIF